MKKKRTLGLVAFVVFCFALFHAPVVSAASCGGVETALVDCGSTESGIGHILSLVINIMSVIIGIVGAIGIAIAGVQYLSAKDSEDKVRKAKRRIFEIVIGLAVYVLLVVIVQWLLPGGSLNPSDLPHYDVPEQQGGDNNGGGDNNNTNTKTGGEKIAEIAKWAAWPIGSDQSGGVDRNGFMITKNYESVLNKVGSSIVNDCANFVGSVVRYSGLDPSFPYGYTLTERNYLRGSNKWQKITNQGNASNLKPGDIFIFHWDEGNTGHTFIYLGNGQIAEANWCGINCGQPPHMGALKWGGEYGANSSYEIYRYKD